jgi:tRNA threonylcarbamoyl adenosine modification protein YeaZ
VQLVIDSATAACSVALIDGDRVIDERHELVGRGHAERLVPMIAELLDGSFTGLRVGLAAAHGLAIGWAVPLHGYSSLAAIAAAVPGPELAVALHGGHGQLFVQTYARDPLRPLDPLRSITPAEAAAVISADLVAGSGAGDLVEARGFGEARDLLPRAADVRLLPSELRSLAPRPIYGRAPDAKPMAE